MFANGAVTGAFTMLFNELAHKINQKGSSLEGLTKESSKSVNSSGDGYGDTFKERVTMLKLWKQAGYEFLFGGIDDPNVIQLSMADNPISFIMRHWGNCQKPPWVIIHLEECQKQLWLLQLFLRRQVSVGPWGRWFTPPVPVSN